MRIILNSLMIGSLLWSLFIVGCSKAPPLDEMMPEEMYHHNRALFDRGRYLDASDGFNYFTLNYSGHGLVDSAQYFIAQSHFEMKEYLISVDAFEELVRRFPNSQIVAESMYMIGKCYWELSPKFALDQEFTHSAIDALQSFIDYFPDHKEMGKQAQVLIGKCRDKLAHKHYYNGVIYLKMKQYTAASIYFRGVMDQYYDTLWAADATYKLALSLSGEDKFEESREVLVGFIQKYSNHEMVDEARAQLNRTVNNESQ